MQLMATIFSGDGRQRTVCFPLVYEGFDTIQMTLAGIAYLQKEHDIGDTDRIFLSTDLLSKVPEESES